MGRPPKQPEDRLVTLSVRVPAKSLALLERVVEGEAQFLRQRHLPTRGVNQSTAFRTIWELGELEYFLQRATLWVTRRNNRYTVEQAAGILGWKVEALRDALRDRGVDVGEPEPAPPAPPVPPTDPPKMDPRFLV